MDANPLAGPANRQGRIAADVISGRDSVTVVLKHLDLSNFRWCDRLDRRQREAAYPAWGDRFEKIYLYRIRTLDIILALNTWRSKSFSANPMDACSGRSAR